MVFMIFSTFSFLPLPSPSSDFSESDPLLSASFTTESDDSSPESSLRFAQIIKSSISDSNSPKLIDVISGHVGSVSCLALSGEFVLSASQGKDIIVWQQPDLKQFAKFGHGDGSVKALITVGNRVFTAHQDSRIRVWRISRSSENIFKLVTTLPTTKDYLGKFMKQSNYVQTRRHHRKLWIEHADSISCLAVSGDLIYSGSWDKTLKVWRMSDLRCLESIKAHDDAINGLQVARKTGEVYSASADGKIKVWAKKNSSHELKATLEGHKDVSMNSVAVMEDEDGEVIVYGGGSDGYLMGWKKEKLVCEIKAHKMAILCVCVKGEFLLSGSADKSIGIWRKQGNGGLKKAEGRGRGWGGSRGGGDEDGDDDGGVVVDRRRKEKSEEGEVRGRRSQRKEKEEEGEGRGRKEKVENIIKTIPYISKEYKWFTWLRR